MLGMTQLSLWVQTLLLICFALPTSATPRILLQSSGVVNDIQETTDGDTSRKWWIYVIIPFVSGFVGYITNIIAIKMAFGPTEFWGWKLWQPKGQPFGLFGWQGIVPAKASVMAGRLTTLFTTKLFSVKEIFSRVDPAVVSKLCEPGSVAISKSTTDEIVKTLFPAVWSALPKYVKDEVIDLVYKESSSFITILMNNLKENITNVLDLTAMSTRLAEENKRIVIDMFLEVGENEYRFVELSGLVFGFIFGLFQTAIFFFWDNEWVLPVAGLLVGWVTNVLALKLIFQPAEPHKIFCFTIQGVFLKRQKEVSVQIADLATKWFLTPEIILGEIMNGSKKDAFHEMLDAVSFEYVDRVANPLEKMAASVLFGPEGMEKLKATVAATVRSEIHTVLPLCSSHVEQALDLKQTMLVALQQLPATDFIGILRPVFQEDEVKLIAVGALLGMLVGFIQQWGLFAYIA
eukprot:evm.model.scf_171.9 EVM.evm.TU.scf_171.9   scf_171:69862-73698(+)